MPVKAEREYRSMPMPGIVERAAGEEEKSYKVRGYFTTYDQPYVLWKDPIDGTEYKEVIDRHALDEADISDVIMQYDHFGRVYARQSNNTLTLGINDDHGPWMEADLSRTSAARDFFEDIESGMVTRMSWAFTIEDDEYDIETHTRRIKKVSKVYDVSAVSMPANPDTEISARAYCEERAKEAADREAAALAEKYEERKAECLKALGATINSIHHGGEA